MEFQQIFEEPLNFNQAIQKGSDEDFSSNSNSENENKLGTNPDTNLISQKKKRGPRLRYQMWKVQQNTTFLKYLTDNLQYFDNMTTKRKNKVFVSLARILPPRTSNQCKSHYQKLQKMTKNKTIPEVIKVLQKIIKKEKGALQRIERKRESDAKKLQKKDLKGKQFDDEMKFPEIKLMINLEIIPIW